MSNPIEIGSWMEYNPACKKKISSGQGDQRSDLKFPTGGIVRDPLQAVDLVRFHGLDSIVWMREEHTDTYECCTKISA